MAPKSEHSPPAPDPPSPPFRDLTVGALLARLAETLPEHEALVYADRGLRLTFAALEAEARLIARGLMACGVARRERVAVWATNVPEWVVLQFALAKIGAILVTVNTALRAHEIDYLLRQSEAATLITIRGFKDVDYLAALAEVGALSGPRLARVVFIGERLPRRADAVRRAARPRRGGHRRRTRRARARGGARRRDQHAVHVGHDRLPEGRHALEPEHRQQRLLARGRAGLHARATGSASASRSFTASAASSACSARTRTAPASARSSPSTRGGCSRWSSGSAARRSTACRRCSSPSWRTRSSRASTSRRCARGSWRARPARSRSMRRVMAEMHLTETDDRLRPDRGLARHHADAARRPARAAHRRRSAACCRRWRSRSSIPRPARRSRRARRASSASAATNVMHGLLTTTRTRRAWRSTRRAGCGPATGRRSTATGTSGSPGGSRT